jgi:ABC-type transport system substrate-binding protein
MKPLHAIQSSVIVLGIAVGALAGAPAFAAGRPVVFLNNAEPDGLDPMFSSASAGIMLSIHETLFRLDNDGKIVPAVAESIRLIDPLTWEIKIRPGLVFHNDEPINADAVVFTLSRAKRLFAAGQGDLNFALGALRYDRAEKVDDLTVRIVMQVPDPIITSHMVNPELSILPPKYYSENSPEQVVFAPVGAGGYRFVSYKPGEGLVLKAFDKYRLGRPPVEDVIVKAVPEVATRISELKAGSADLVVGVPPDLKSDLEESGEAGWVPGADGVRVKDGVRLSLNFDTTNGSYLMDKEVAQVMTDSWQAVGIEIKDLRVISNAVSAQMRAKQGAGFRDLMNSSSGPDYTCQGDLLLVQKDSGSNRMSWVDEKFEAMFKAFSQEFDQSKWQAMCNEAQAYVAEQAPVVWMFTEPTLYGVSKRLTYQARPDGRTYLNLVLKGVKE